MNTAALRFTYFALVDMLVLVFRVEFRLTEVALKINKKHDQVQIIYKAGPGFWGIPDPDPNGLRWTEAAAERQRLRAELAALSLRLIRTNVAQSGHEFRANVF